MYKNLKNELHKKGIALKSFAEFLGISDKTIQNKMNGTTAFSYPEVEKTNRILFPEFNLEYLFKKEDKEICELEKDNQSV